MPNSPFVDMPQEKPAELLATLRRAIRLPAGPPHPMAVCHGTPPDGDRRRPVLLALPRVPHGASLSEGSARLRAQRPGAARAAGAHHGTAPHAATIAAGPPQGLAPNVWVVPHALARCHAGPAPAGQPGPHGLGRDHASLAP